MQRTQRSRTSCEDTNSCAYCLIKAVLFITLSVFVLYAPLGDNKGFKGPSLVSYSWVKDNAVKFSQNAGKIILIFLEKAFEVLKVLCNITLDLLYEIKMEFYALIEKLDRDDICKVLYRGTEARNQGPKELTDFCQNQNQGSSLIHHASIIRPTPSAAVMKTSKCKCRMYCRRRVP